MVKFLRPRRRRWRGLAVRPRPQKLASRRNLSRWLPKPALGNGRLQRQAKLAFWGCGSPLSTSEILEWAYPRKVLGERIGDGHRWSCRRALERIRSVRWSRLRAVAECPQSKCCKTATPLEHPQVLHLCHITFAGISMR